MELVSQVGLAAWAPALQYFSWAPACSLYERHRLAERCATVVTANRQLINSAEQSRPDDHTHPSSTAGRQAQASGSDRTRVGTSSLGCSCKPLTLVRVVYVQHYVNAGHVSNNCAARAEPSVSFLFPVDSKGFPSVRLTKPLQSLLAIDSSISTE